MFKEHVDERQTSRLKSYLPLKHCWHRFSRNVELFRRTVKLLVVFNASFLGSESHGTHGHILLSGGPGSSSVAGTVICKSCS
jgi:hypothetical protein